MPLISWRDFLSLFSRVPPWSMRKVPVFERLRIGTAPPFAGVFNRLPLSGMQVPDPTPAAKGLAVAAACLVAIPAVCRWIENAPALGLAMLLLAMVRIIHRTLLFHGSAKFR